MDYSRKSRNIVFDRETEDEVCKRLKECNKHGRRIQRRLYLSKLESRALELERKMMLSGMTDHVALHKAAELLFLPPITVEKALKRASDIMLYRYYLGLNPCPYPN